MDLRAHASLHTPLEATRPAPRPQRGTRARDWERPHHLPSKAALEYWRLAITVLVLVLALPWLAGKLLTNPAEVLSAAGQKVVKPGA